MTLAIKLAIIAALILSIFIPRTMMIQFGFPAPSVIPPSIRTTSIIAAWLTANAPIRTNEIVLEKKLNIVSNNSKNPCKETWG